MIEWFYKWIAVWFQPWWYTYLFEPRRYDDEPWIRVLWCRARGHPSGVVFYNSGGMEPNYTCKGCGDDLG